MAGYDSWCESWRLRLGLPDLVPFELGDLVAATSGQDEQPHGSAKLAAFVACIPDGSISASFSALPLLPPSECVLVSAIGLLKPGSSGTVLDRPCEHSMTA